MSSRLDWRRVRSCGSHTSCIAMRAERQPCRLDSTGAGAVMLFTYCLYCKASRTSAMSSRLDWRPVRSCGSLTRCIAKQAERQPCRLDSTGGGCGHAVHLLPALQRELKVSHVVSTRLEAGAVMRFPYFLHCKGSRTSPMSSRLDWRQVQPRGSLTSFIAKRAESQPCRLYSNGGGCGHAVNLLSALQSEPNVSLVVSTRLEAGAIMRFTYFLHYKASRTSAVSSRLDWRRVRSCASLTVCIATRAEREPCRLDSTGGGCGHAVHLLSALQSKPNVSHVISTRLEAGAVVRFTYILHCKGSRTSAMSSRLDWRRVRSCGSFTSCIAKRAERQPCCLTSTGGGCGHAVHLLSALQSKPNVIHVVSTRRSSGSLTGCIAKGAERQPCRLDSTGGGCGHAVHLLPALQSEPNVSHVVSTRLEAGAVMRFTYILHCNESRTSAMSSRLDWRRVRSCGSLTSCIAKRAEHQPCCLTLTEGGCGHAVHLLSTLQSEPNVSHVVSTRRSCGSLTGCIAK